MKLDSILLAGVGVVILLIIAGLGLGAVMIFFGDEGTPGKNATTVKYQCYNGNIVSKLSDCPRITVTTVEGGVVSTCQTSASRPSATCAKCDCLTRPTTSPPTTLCIACSSAASCGSARTDRICKAGELNGVSYDVWDVTYSPLCSNGCCIWASARNPKATCTDTQTCINGTCVQRPDTSEEE